MTRTDGLQAVAAARKGLNNLLFKLEQTMRSGSRTEILRMLQVVDRVLSVMELDVLDFLEPAAKEADEIQPSREWVQ